MNNVKIKKAEEIDVDIIVEMLADDELGNKREDQNNRKAYLHAFKQIRQDPNQELMVTKIDEKVVGTFQLSFIQYLTYQGGIRAQIEAVRIHKQSRGQGLGKKMFLWAIERAKEKGAHVLQLTTDKKRPEALQFYENLGFTASHSGMKLYLKNNNE